MKKKLIALGLIATMTLSMVACGNEDNTGSNTDTSVATNTDTNDTNGETENTTEKIEEVSDLLSEEYLLSLLETDPSQFSYEETEDGIVITYCYVESNEDTIVVIPNQIDG